MDVIVNAPRVPASLLTEATLLRRLNIAQHRAGKLRRAGLLVPDYTTDGQVRLYQPARVNALALAVQQFTELPAANPKA